MTEPALGKEPVFALDQQGGEMAALNLDRILHILGAHRKFLLLFPVCCLLTTYFGLAFVQPLYKSTAEILVVDPRVQIGEVAQRLSSFETDNAAMGSDIALLQSKGLALRLATDLRLDKDSEFYRPKAAGWRAWLGLTQPSKVDESGDRTAFALDRAAEQLRKKIQVERVQLSYVLAVSVSSEDPAKAQRLAQAAANAFLRERREIRDETMQRALDWWKSRVMELRARVAETESDLEKLKAENGIVDSAANPAMQRLNALRTDAQAYAKLRELEPVADSYRKFYEAALGQLDAITQRLSLEGIGGRLITPASLPEAPSYPRRGIISAIVGVLSTGAAVGLVFLLELLSGGVKTAAALEGTSGYPVIGMLPLVSCSRGPLGRNPVLQRLLETPHSALAQGVRAARTMLRLYDPVGSSRMLLVTSAMPGEGKSTVAMLLAASSARSGERAVLIDCDVRGRSVSREFGLYRPGWTDVLVGSADLASVTLTDPKIGFSVIPVGCAGDPNQLLFEEPMRDLLMRLREDYDSIILDTAPILGAIDPLVLASSVDKILPVVEWNRTRQATVSEALNLCRFETHRIGGLILNKVDYDRLQAYGYGARYKYAAASAA